MKELILRYKDTFSAIKAGEDVTSKISVKFGGNNFPSFVQKDGILKKFVDGCYMVAEPLLDCRECGMVHSTVECPFLK